VITHNQRKGPARWWIVQEGGTTIWNLVFRFDRVGFHWKLLRHRYALTSDRWVWQVSHHYDCKRKRGET
jgi:hypothetical protein